MIVAKEQISSRDVQLFANSYAVEYEATITNFDIENLYDTILIDKPNIIIVDSLDNRYYDSLFDDIKNNNIFTQTKFIVLNNKSTQKNISYNNIKYIPRNTYKPYDEYIKPSASELFILANINCENIKINDKLEPILYPNKICMPVRLINCAEYNNYHNLGVLNEQDTLNVLARCDTYINTDNKYLYDAVFLGKKVISLVENDLIPITNTIDESIVEKAVATNINLSQYKISNIIQYIK